MLESGLNLCAFKGHGKTRMLFNLAENLQKRDNVRVLIFDGSLAWLFGYNRIPVFEVRDHDILSNERKTSEDLEKYSLEIEHLIRLALMKHKDLLFSLKTRNPKKRAFLVRKIILMLDEQQRTEKEENPEHLNKQALIYFLEEASNTFNSRSTSSNEAEEFMSFYNECRNFNETVISATQRLTDMSKSIRAKQLTLLGKLSPEDLTPYLKKIEREHSLDFSNMKSRTWFYNGVVIESPTFKQKGKPYLINEEIKQLWHSAQPKQIRISLSDKLLSWLNPTAFLNKTLAESKRPKTPYSFFESEQQEEKEENSESEESLSEEERDLREIEEELI